MRAAGAVREAVGAGAAIYADGNQQWSAARRCRRPRLEPFRLGWLEEPLPAEEIERLAEVRRRVRDPIATGETNYGLDEFAG